MSDRDERRKILDMLAAGQIDADQATELLKALGSPKPPTPPSPPKPRGIAKLLRINVDVLGDEDTKQAKVRVNIPLALAKFASKFMPEEAKSQLDLQGIDLAELLDTLGDDLPEGKLVDIDASEEGEGKTAKITIEVV